MAGQAAVNADWVPEDRDLVPRWRPFLPTARTGELEAVGSRGEASVTFGEPTGVDEFRDAPGLFTAGDILSQAAVSGSRSEIVADAARLVRGIPDAGSAVQGLADLVLGDIPAIDDVARAVEPFGEQSARARAREMRRILRDQPRNAVRWTDLALVHVNLGQLAQARREMEIATRLAPNNRFVLRSAARLYVLLDEPDRGLRLLQSSDAKLDPWIQSAEISLSEQAGRRSSEIRRAKQAVEAGDLPPFHISELAGEVATTELRYGNTRVARRLMRTALINPTENTVAQAEWASHHGVSNPNPAALDLPRSFEARALDASARGEFDVALQEGIKWQADQPFDSNAGTFVSYASSVLLERYDIGISAARLALQANPNDPMLRNNLVFGLASSGRHEEAARELSALVTLGGGDSQEATILATRGLVEFRNRSLDEGRLYYRAAIDRFAKLGDPNRMALAMVFLAREELAAGTPDAAAAIEFAVAAAAKVKAPEVRVWAVRLVERALKSGISLNRPR
jgi:tetratricopeptide (TPR) repeat protein